LPEPPRRPHNYWPLAGPFLFVLLAATLTAVALVIVGAISYAYRRIGLDQNWLFAALFGSILGSRINIPIRHFSGGPHREVREVTSFGVRYRVPVTVQSGRTTLAVNVGGALIPTALATYLIIHDRLWLQSLIAVVIVSTLIHFVARPVPGLGIVTPALLPPCVAALTAIAVSAHSDAGLAYICGTLGTLIGADLTNIHKIKGMGAPVASIGGAGTFDGIFLTGVLAVILA
jgi:uncharacterized membrane protein